MRSVRKGESALRAGGRPRRGKVTTLSVTLPAVTRFYRVPPPQNAAAGNDGHVTAHGAAAEVSTTVLYTHMQ